MRGSSFVAGWRRARAASRPIAVGWLGELLVLLAAAAIFAADLAAGLAATPAGEAIVSGDGSAGVYGWVLSLAEHTPLALGVVAAAVLLVLAWRVVWQGGLAMTWLPASRTSARRTVQAGIARFGAFLWLGALGAVLELSSAGLTLLATSLLRAGPTPGRWWYTPALLALRTGLALAVWMLAAATVQRARWEVAAGAGAVRALARGAVACGRHPLANGFTILSWGVWTLAWLVAWLAIRWLASFTDPGSVLAGLALLSAVMLALTWGRGALVLAFAQSETGVAP